MLAILNSLNVHNLPFFQPILMILVSKSMVHRALSDKTYLLLGLLSPLKFSDWCIIYLHYKWQVISRFRYFTTVSFLPNLHPRSYAKIKPS